jgi:hypothetical protein
MTHKGLEFSEVAAFCVRSVKLIFHHSFRFIVKEEL